MASELGFPVPELPYAVSVSIPTWKSNMGYGRKESWVMDSLQTGYPRFVIPRNIESFAQALLKSSGEDPSTKNAMLFPSALTAAQLVSFLEVRDVAAADMRIFNVGVADVHAVIYPKVYFALAKNFWQHTGEGISSRRCDVCRTQWETKHQLVANGPPTPPAELNAVTEGARAKEVMCDRISELVGAGTTAEDVWLFSSGMSAMFNTHKMLLATLGNKNSISFGFPYVDTLKILQKWGPGALFYGNGTPEDLDALETRLEAGERFLALFCETPGNPLLRSPDLVRIRRLAEQYDFAIVVDETIGNWVNVDVLAHGVDVIVTSLTKAFSGVCNVMGGCAVLNPSSRYYEQLKATMATQYEDNYWPEDAVVMEANSRDFAARVKKMSSNALALSKLLDASPKIREVYYPALNPSTRPFYEAFKRPDGGYGFLLSFYFHTPEHIAPFLDEVDTAKGPSLGTNFTLTSPYTILAHFGEQEWAESFGVSIYLVRVSVGLEEEGELLERFRSALAVVPDS